MERQFGSRLSAWVPRQAVKQARIAAPFEPFMAACPGLIDAHVDRAQAPIEGAQQALSPVGTTLDA